jgi:hypothetical protein
MNAEGVEAPPGLPEGGEANDAEAAGACKGVSQEGWLAKVLPLVGVCSEDTAGNGEVAAAFAVSELTSMAAGMPRGSRFEPDPRPGEAPLGGRRNELDCCCCGEVVL